MKATNTIDVKGLGHAEKEGLIFPGIEALKPGEDLRIVVEFNPIPLVYMLKAQDKYAVTYEKEGPDEWILAVRRTSPGEEDKKGQLKELISELGKGEVSEETKSKARTLLGSVDATTLGLLEQELIREGVSHDAIRSSLCDIHLEAMRDSLVAKRIEVEAPHPINTLMEEHKALLRDLKDLSGLIDRLRDADSFDAFGAAAVARLKDISHHLVEAERHHQREEEVLFPRLEAHDVVEPPEIMKLDHVEFRKRKHALHQLTHDAQGAAFPEYKTKATELGQFLAKELESHIFKEDNILYQIALQVLAPGEWDEIKRECDRIGYCCLTPEGSHKEEKNVENYVKDLDLRKIDIWDRHDLIFKEWDALKPGETLRIINDHNPKPLRYQFEAEFKGRYAWEYEQEGPKDWMVRIKKLPVAGGTHEAAENPTDILREEHSGVLKKLDSLESIVSRPDGKPGTGGELKDLAAFFQTEFWVHFAKEENALFPEIEKFMPRDMGPVGVMLAEHEDLRATNQELQKAIRAYLAGPDGAQARAEMKKYGLHFTTVLRDHIGKEDNILFGMADMHLDPGQKSAVARLFKQIEKEQGVAARP